MALNAYSLQDTDIKSKKTTTTTKNKHTAGETRHEKADVTNLNPS